MVPLERAGSEERRDFIRVECHCVHSRATMFSKGNVAFSLEIRCNAGRYPVPCWRLSVLLLEGDFIGILRSAVISWLYLAWITLDLVVTTD